MDEGHSGQAVSLNREENNLSGRIPSALRHLGRVQRSFLTRPDIFGVLNDLRAETHRNQIDSDDEESNISISIDIGTNTNQDNRNNSDNSNDGIRPSPETVAIMAMIQRYLPFTFIVIAKALFDHGIGLLVGAALLITFSHANSRLKREVSLQGRRSLGALAFLALHVAVCVILLYVVFEDEQLYRSLWLAPSYSQPLTLPQLLWVVTVTDFVLKLGTIVVKAAITAMPARLIAYPKRGKVFLAVEATSQLYRAMAPLQPWLYYLVEAYQGMYKVVGVCLSAAYLVCKCRELLARLRAWHTAASQCLSHSALGKVPTAQQLSSAGPMCTICHDQFQCPVALVCSHVFCESCLTTWCDREQSCPLCRAKVGTDPAWRDGSTSFFLQLF